MENKAVVGTAVPHTIDSAWAEQPDHETLAIPRWRQELNVTKGCALLGVEGYAIVALFLDVLAAQTEGQQVLEVESASPSGLAPETSNSRLTSPHPQNFANDLPILAWIEADKRKDAQSAPYTPNAPQGRSMIAEEGDHARDN